MYTEVECKHCVVQSASRIRAASCKRLEQCATLNFAAQQVEPLASFHDRRATFAVQHWLRSKTRATSVSSDMGLTLPTNDFYWRTVIEWNEWCLCYRLHSKGLILIVLFYSFSKFLVTPPFSVSLQITNVLTMPITNLVMVNVHIRLCAEALTLTAVVCCRIAESFVGVCRVLLPWQWTNSLHFSATVTVCAS